MFIVLFLFLSHPVFASDEIVLPQVLVEGTPSDVLSSDPILPQIQGQRISGTSSGSLEKSVSSTVPVPFSEEQKPGSLSQIRGFGRSAEDTQVQTLGIPLNPALGGGFNFATFPQFLWSTFDFRAGPSLTGFDPRGNAGTLNLVPWSAQALTTKKNTQGEALESVFGTGINEFSVAYASRGESAAVMGLSSGKSQGPSGSLSQRWSLGSTEGKFHFLGTSLDSKSDGSVSVPTPSAHLYTARAIPVAQADFKLQPDLLWKSSLFLDWAFSRYDDPEHPENFTRDWTQQLGTENAIISGPWKCGISARRIYYHRADFEAPTETLGNLQLTYSGGSDSLLVEPTLQATSVTGYGLAPAGSLGLRKDWNENFFASARGSFSRRFPSLQDRYYVLAPFFHGNPELRPEKDWTLILVAEGAPSSSFKLGSQLFLQFRDDAEIQTIDSVTNAGSAAVGAATVWGSLSPSRIFLFSLSGTAADSHVTANGARVPYLPRLLGVGSAQANFFPSKGWELTPAQAGVFFRGWRDVIAPDLGPMDSGGYLDLEASSQLIRRQKQSVIAILRLENVLNTHVELTRGYPLYGRALGASLQARF